MTQLIFQSVSQEELKKLIKDAILEILPDRDKESSKKESSGKNIYLTRKQTADLLQISLPTLHQYTKNCFIASYRIGNKIRYKESDIKAAIQERNFGRRRS